MPTFDWQKSSYCAEGNNCLELADSADGILVREGESPDTLVVTSPARLRAFISGVKAGEFDHFV